jgi:uncharacterized protein
MSEEKYTDKEFIEYVVKMLVDKPEAVKVERKIDEMGVLISLDVDAQDMGMVIGRDGMTAKALRTLLRVIGARNNARVNLKINEPIGSTHVRRSERTDAPAVATPVATAPIEHYVQPTVEEPKKTVDEIVNGINI